MIYAVGVDNKDGTAKIDGLLDIDKDSKWEPTPGYAYAEGYEPDSTHYMVFVDGGWQLAPKPSFNDSPSSHTVPVGSEVTIVLGVADVEVWLDEEYQGVDKDGVIVVEPATVGTYRLEFEKFPYKPKKVLINAT